MNYNADIQKLKVSGYNFHISELRKHDKNNFDVFFSGWKNDFVTEPC